MTMTQFPGKPFPLGATWDGEGVNFALYSENATAVELCLFAEATDTVERLRINIAERDNHIWHVYLPGIGPGQLYGYRVHGPYEPHNGHRFNANKLLIDPYAKAISGNLIWNDTLFGYDILSPEQDLNFDERDNAAFVPKSAVINPHFDWEGDERPSIPYNETIIYEAHVKGFTKLNPAIPAEIRGTYAALGHPVTIQYLKDLGITAIELMPIHHFVQDKFLADKALQNYWGYNTIGFFAPDSRYAANSQHGAHVTEFKEMVKALHKGGIEVILDVVYNHTAEGNQLGPTLCYRGVDNLSHYRLTDDKRFYMDYTGTGNTLNAKMPNVMRMIMDSLRYWVLEMHIDGFRFDLAAALARELHAVDRLGSFFQIIHQDPVISQVKLIAEPWDIGEGGYQVGNFPPGWAEWNGKYRDCMRDYWRGADGVLAEFALRFTGSPDLYQEDYRHPTASINFITAHDGFTLNDLVSYNEKHNEANGENNNDGESHNKSWNHGEEGDTTDNDIINLRNRQTRNFLTTLMLSQGVPMIVAGDELGRTQKGNNNAYCQDNEISWIDWQIADKDLLDFTRKLIQFSKKHRVFRRKKWFKGRPSRGIGPDDITWFQPNGKLMRGENWSHGFAKSLGVFLNGKEIHALGPKGEPVVDDNFYLVFNAHHDVLPFTLPPPRFGKKWMKLLDTSLNYFEETGEVFKSKQKLVVNGRSVVLLKEVIK
jgi:isoamylase